MDSWRPRARGAAPGRTPDDSGRTTASPRTRGCTSSSRSEIAGIVGVPAHAGLHPGWSTCGTRIEGRPRARGAAPAAGRAVRENKSASPRTRGCTLIRWSRPRSGRGVPAHAGLHPELCSRNRGQSRRPRARGAAPRGIAARSVPRGASPRTRGCTLSAWVAVPHATGVPAHAGLHPNDTGRGVWQHRRPRARGAAPTWTFDGRSQIQASPRTRGCTS